MYHFLFLFFTYAFLGWCTEVSYAALRTGRFVNRGFLNGPICPIYGVGAVLVLALLEPLACSKLLVFFSSILLTSGLELVTGFLLEKLFHQRWWDYSGEPFNLGGYICLRFSIAWGLACTFVVYLIHPTVLLILRLIPHALGVVLLCVLCAAACADFIVTVCTITRLNRQLSQIDELAAKIRGLSDELGENLADKVLGAAERHTELKENLETFKDTLALHPDSLKEDLDEWKEDLHTRALEKKKELEALRTRLEEALDRHSFGQDRLLKAFPRMRSLKHHKALEKLRNRRSRH